MVVFIDTSSLIKRYVNEEGSKKIDELFNLDPEICLSPLTEIEFISALKRKINEGTIDKSAFDTANDLWSSDLPSYSILPFDSNLKTKVLEIVNEYNIKTLDSVQVASAILSIAEKWVTSDKKMFEILQNISASKSELI